jgi:deoxycytidylate deaminase
VELSEKYVQKYVEILLEQAKAQEPVRSSRITAGLIYKNELLFVGKNKLKSHPFQKRFGKNELAIYLHAEIDCIVNAVRNNMSLSDISKSTMIVVRTKQEKKGMWWPATAKPCSGCQRAIAHFGISNVLYTTELGNDYL